MSFNIWHIIAINSCVRCYVFGSYVDVTSIDNTYTGVGSNVVSTKPLYVLKIQHDVRMYVANPRPILLANRMVNTSKLAACITK